MNGHKKVIKDIIPVTTTKAVYIDGTNKTLQEAIDNGELGGGVTSTNNFVTSAYVRCGSVIFDVDSSTKTVTINQDTKYNTARIVDVYMSNGGVYNYVLPENGFSLKDGEAAMYKNGSELTIVNGAIVVNYNDVLLAYNFGGRITEGILAPIFAKQEKTPGYLRARTIGMEEILKDPTNLSLHSMFVYNNKLVTLECNSLGNSYVLDLATMKREKSFRVDFTKQNEAGEDYEFRLVASDYKYNALVFGNSTSTGREDVAFGYIFYEVSNWFDSAETITFANCGSYTSLDFTEIHINDGTDYGIKMCWGERDDIVYISQKDLKYCHKILLGKGTNQLEKGVYDSDTSKTYNGTYRVIKTYYNPNRDLGGCKDLEYYNGSLLYSIKYVFGGLRVHRAYLNDLTDTIEVELLVYDPIDSNGNHEIAGSPEGIVIYNDHVYLGHTTNYFYKFPVTAFI